MDDPNKEREESKIITTTYATSNNRLKFLIQSLIAVIIILFSVTQITIHPDRDNSIWVGLICTILGLFFPHPTPMMADVAAGGDGQVGEREGSGDDQAQRAPRTATTTHTRSRPSPVVQQQRALLAVLPEGTPPQLQNETKNS